MAGDLSTNVATRKESNKQKWSTPQLNIAQQTNQNEHCSWKTLEKSASFHCHLSYAERIRRALGWWGAKSQAHLITDMEPGRGLDMVRRCLKMLCSALEIGINWYVFFWSCYFFGSSFFFWFHLGFPLNRSLWTGGSMIPGTPRIRIVWTWMESLARQDMEN